MIGTIIGDIVGSRFEFNNHKNKEFEFFSKDCFVTDDSIMTLAVEKAILETNKFIDLKTRDIEYYSLLESMLIKYMQQIGRKYPNSGFGGMFEQWIHSDNPKPYKSYGNGAAMRISPVGFIADTESELINLSKVVTSITHNHIEGIKGAEATALSIYMAKHKYSKKDIKKRIEKQYYQLNFTIDEIRNSYHFDVTCKGAVPVAIEFFLESTSFEDAIRIAISVGGDSDTIAAITGSIAEAYYGVPEVYKEKALTYLDDELRMIYDDWYLNLN